MKKFDMPIYRQNGTNKSIRFPNDLIEEIEKVRVCKKCTFSAVVIAAVEFALENMSEEERYEPDRA